MHLSPVDCAIRAFGGVRTLAGALRQYPGTICRWRTRAAPSRRPGQLPPLMIERALGEARARGLPLTAEELILGREVDGAQRCPAPASP